MALDMGGFAEAGFPVRTDPATRDTAFIDLRAGGSTRFSLSKGGVVTLPLGLVSAPSISFAGSSNTGFWSSTAGSISFSSLGTESNRIDSSGSLGTTRPIRFGSTITTTDTSFQRDAANVLAQISGTNPQMWRLYNTFTDASNYERLAAMAVAADDFKIIPEALGTGTLRGLQLGSSGGKLGFYGTTAVTKPTALTASDGTLANAVIRQGELESKLQSLGLLT